MRKVKQRKLIDPWESWKYDGYKVDKEVKYCKTCNQCWQLDTGATRNIKKINRSELRGKGIYAWYKDFPRIGKKREECPRCKIKI
tara:strand:+ start:13 stop:267 length:255 start_codon:yes stop_codon:yes gene_type:complete